MVSHSFRNGSVACHLREAFPLVVHPVQVSHSDLRRRHPLALRQTLAWAGKQAIRSLFVPPSPSDGSQARMLVIESHLELAPQNRPSSIAVGYRHRSPHLNPRRHQKCLQDLDRLHSTGGLELINGGKSGTRLWIGMREAAKKERLDGNRERRESRYRRHGH